MFTIWITGQSASGKTTLAESLRDRLVAMSYDAHVIDGDRIRNGISSDLGFSRDDVRENVRRVAEISSILNDAGVIAIVALISPYTEDRKNARLIVENLATVFIDCPLEIRECRDPKGLYRKVRAGQITGLAGMGVPYEKPESPDVYIDSSVLSLRESVDKVIDCLKEKRWVL